MNWSGFLVLSLRSAFHGSKVKTLSWGGEVIEEGNATRWRRKVSGGCEGEEEMELRG